MVRTGDSIRLAVEALASREEAFAQVVAKHGIPEPRRSEPGAHTLLRTIVGQQVSVAAARSMWSKLEAAYGSPPDLNAILKATDDELRLAGISRQKAGYARSLAAKKIRANAISPGATYFEGGYWAEVEKERPADFKSMLDASPLGRMATPHEIADAALFLVSSRASIITGANLIADGAYTTRANY